jgi:hypothetical protein
MTSGAARAHSCNKIEAGKQAGSLFAWRSGARDQFEVKDAQLRAASGGDRFAVVLEFELISRIIASMHSMNF